MNNYKNTIIKDLTSQTESPDRYKLFWIKSLNKELSLIEKMLKDTGIPLLDIGLELSKKLSQIKDTRFLSIDAQEYIRSLIESHAKKPGSLVAKSIAIYNLGILFEKDLGLDPSFIIKEISKTTTIIILWENLFDEDGRLFWDHAIPDIGFNFSDTNLKEIKINHEI